jgi:hypothetical protein
MTGAGATATSSVVPGKVCSHDDVEVKRVLRRHLFLRMARNPGLGPIA